MCGRGVELKTPQSISRVLGLIFLPLQSGRDRQVVLLTHPTLNQMYSIQEQTGIPRDKERQISEES